MQVLDQKKLLDVDDLSPNSIQNQNKISIKAYTAQMD